MERNGLDFTRPRPHEILRVQSKFVAQPFFYSEAVALVPDSFFGSAQEP